jgi:hypothetical protein
MDEDYLQQEQDNVEVVLSIGKIYSEKDEIYLPCLKDEASHDIDPMWVSAVMYLILDRYISSIPEDKQVDFYDTTLRLFEKIKEEGAQYILKVPRKE